MKFTFFVLWMTLWLLPLFRSLYRLWKKQEVERREWIRGGIAAAIGLFLFLVLDETLGIWVRKLWFVELAQEERFWTIFWTKWACFLSGFGLTAAFLSANIRLTQNKSLVKVKGLYPLAYSGVAVISLAVGLVVLVNWNELLLYFNQTDFGIIDPIFRNDVGFYVFSLPAYSLIRTLLIIIMILAIAGVFGIYEIQFRHQAREFFRSQLVGRSGRYRDEEERPQAEDEEGQSKLIRFHQLTHVSLLGVLFMGAMVFHTIVSKWETLFSTRGAVFGAGWTDVNVQLPAYDTFIVIAIICAILLAISAAARSFRLTKLGSIWGFGICLAVWVLGVWVAPALTQKIFLSSNETKKEQSYIEHDIRFTRQAYGLTEDKLQVVDFPVNMGVDASLLSKNRDTLGTVRLWDFRVLRDTYSQTQAFRTYYAFPDVDVVRYRLGGKLVQFMCSAREMDHERLSEQSNTWQNKHLFYTHGFGLVANPADVFLPPEGLPEYWVGDIPPVSRHPEMKITQPRIYFGEKTTGHVYVKTRQAEFDYPKGEHNESFRYDGSGGVEIGSGFRKFAIAWVFDGFRFLASDEIAPESRIMYGRDIETRVKDVAPFLAFDRDPYQVIADGGLWYLWDAYTTSSHYPYSSPYAENKLNYIRNSVKVTVNAFTGKVDLYVFDESDPIIRAYQKIFPKMFRPASEMPAALREHIRYPEDLMKIQGDIYGRYHMTDPVVFYNKEDAWEPSREISGNNKTHTIVPYYVIMRMPGGKSDEFALIYPFSPYTKDPAKDPRSNMVAWLAGRCDGENYGKLLVYLFPKERFISGPQQIGIRINQDDVISKDISLWSQKGSQVIFGNLLVLPLADFRLMYVQPIYIQAEQGKMPELKRVVVFSGDKIAYGTSFEDALRKLVGLTNISVAPAAVSSGPAKKKAGTSEELIQEAVGHYNLYRQYSGQGKFAEAGKELEGLGRTLSVLNGQ